MDAIPLPAPATWLLVLPRRLPKTEVNNGSNEAARYIPTSVPSSYLPTYLHVIDTLHLLLVIAFAFIAKELSSYILFWSLSTHFLLLEHSTPWQQSTARQALSGPLMETRCHRR